MNDAIIITDSGRKTTPFTPPQRLDALLTAAGMLLPMPCGGRGVCGKCRVIASGALESPDDEERALIGSALTDGVRLACRAIAVGDVQIRVPSATNDRIQTQGEGALCADDPWSDGLCVAIDIGTTTVAAYCYHADTGERTACAAAPNPQAAFGADVISRMEKAEAGQADALRTACLLYTSHLVSLLLPPPSVIAQRFHSLYDRSGPAAATAWYYDFCRASNAIRVDSIQKNIGYSAPSPYGKLEITINLSKPEKDPREIARQRSMPSIGYPLCMLCLENEGYAGRPGYPSHETLRTVSLKLCGENWRMQYSPYSYYDEHCIVLNEQHIPMVIERKTFALLLDFEMCIRDSRSPLPLFSCTDDEPGNKKRGEMHLLSFKSRSINKYMKEKLYSRAIFHISAGSRTANVVPTPSSLLH